MNEEQMKENLDRIRSALASVQSTDVTEHPDSERVRKLYWAIEDALTQVKALQEAE